MLHALQVLFCLLDWIHRNDGRHTQTNIMYTSIVPIIIFSSINGYMLIVNYKKAFKNPSLLIF